MLEMQDDVEFDETKANNKKLIFIPKDNYNRQLYKDNIINMN
jgi:hypothetical protein